MVMVQLLLVCSFLASDITSAIKTSATQLTITLASAGTTKILNAFNAGFGADAIGTDDANAADNVDIEAGFIVDDTGNASTNRCGFKSCANLFRSLLTQQSAHLALQLLPAAMALGRTINITATTSETVLKGSAITATLSNNVNVVLTADANGTTMEGITPFRLVIQQALI